MVYLISYDLLQPGQKYEAVHSAIKSFGTWAKPLESTWFVKSNLSAEQVFNKIREAMDANDNLLVLEVSNNYIGHFSTSVHDWLEQHLGN